ncbi:hypothetical protein [Brasilonema octagenarum]|nr:hypothetical protein [Brasilonema octagenarum]
MLPRETPSSGMGKAHAARLTPVAVKAPKQGLRRAGFTPGHNA